MNLSTVAVSIDVAQIIGGAPVPNVRVRFELTGPDVVASTLLLSPPSLVQLNSDGLGTANLVPNTAGTQGQQTKVTAYSEAGELLFTGLATVPDEACNLTDILYLSPPPTEDDGRRAVFNAREWATKTTGPVAGSDLSAKAHALAAAGSSATAAAAAAAAVPAAAAAASSAQSASTSETNAGSSAQSAATARTAINNRWYPGTYAADPTTRPDGSARQGGDTHVTTGGVVKVFTGGFWNAINIDMLSLANNADGMKGAALVGYDGGTVQDVLDSARPMANYTALGNYTGRATSIRITQIGLAGYWLRNDADTTTPANGGTKLRDALGRLWERVFDGAAHLSWFEGAGVSDAVAVQAAFNCGARKVIVRPKRYLLGNANITAPDWLHVVGEGYYPTGTPSSAAVIFDWNKPAGTALSCGLTPTFENIYFVNSAGAFNELTDVLSGTTAACISLTDNLEMIRCSFAFWRKCIQFGASSYYVRTERVEFNRCTAGYSVNGSAPYDVNIYSPISRKTAVFFEGQVANPARDIKIFGGSIEGFSSIAENFLDLSIFSTYLETTEAHNGCFGISPNVNGASVAIFGARVYLNYMARFINMSGLTNVMLTGTGNVYDGIGKAGGIIHYLPDTGTVSLSGDRFGAGHPNDCLYVDSIAKAAKFDITMPLLPAANVQAAYSTLQIVGPRGFWMNALTAAPAAPVAGMTVLADGATWDPLARGYGRPYWVTWQGDRWAEAGGILVATALPDSTAATVADLRADLNTLMAKMRSAKLMAP